MGNVQHDHSKTFLQPLDEKPVISPYSQQEVLDFCEIKIAVAVAIPGGFEPPTFGLGIRRSILLNYGTISSTVENIQFKNFKKMIR